MKSRYPSRVQEIAIDSGRQLHEVIRSHGKRNYYFRGENSAAYPLIPKYGRYQLGDARNDAAREQLLLNEFKRQAAPHIQHLPNNDWEWLAVAQHFGLNTRLLDWTENPLVAAFFACRGPNPSDRVIYALDIAAVDEANELVSPFAVPEVAVYRPKHIATRITAQSGLFTVYPEPAAPFSHPDLERWTIRSSSSAEIWTTLLTYGVHEASVFPDLDGLARYLNIRIVYGNTG